MDSELEFFLGNNSFFVTHYRSSGNRYVIIVPPLFEEMPRTRKILVNLARSLASNGMNVIRFDYFGTGLSDGDFSEFGIEIANDNLSEVISYAKENGASSIDLFGFRFGGYLALSRHLKETAGRLVLWEPLLDLAKYFKDMLRIQVSNQLVTYGEVRNNQKALRETLQQNGKILIDGYPVSLELFDQFNRADQIELSSLVDIASTPSLIFWESKALHGEAGSLGLDSTWSSSDKFSWRHIRFLNPAPRALLQTTLQKFTAG